MILWGLALLAVASWVACAAPISTMRSPYHLRVVEVRNASDQERTLKIEPATDQHLGGATTFTGAIKPGQVKTLYLYHGFDYDFRILDATGYVEVTRKRLPVRRDMNLEFANDSLTSDVHLVAELGEPTLTFADSLQKVDPFGLRRTRFIEPDTSRGSRPPTTGPTGKRPGLEGEVP